MGFLIRIVGGILPLLSRAVSLLLVVRSGVAIIPFVVGVVSSFGLMYAFYHEVNVGLASALSGVQSSMASVPVGGSNVLCYVSAFGVFVALKIVIQAVGIGLAMLAAQWIALQTFLVTQYLLNAAIGALK